ncbi:hypothetical protein BDW75DRAFT_217880, partial [Aspergillus navahoensis]
MDTGHSILAMWCLALMKTSQATDMILFRFWILHCHCLNWLVARFVAADCPWFVTCTPPLRPRFSFSPFLSPWSSFESGGTKCHFCTRHSQLCKALWRPELPKV